MPASSALLKDQDVSSSNSIPKNSQVTSKSIRSANFSSTCKAMHLQQNCISIQETADLILPDLKTLPTLQTSINKGLAKCSAHATIYLNSTVPSVLKNLASIQVFYQSFTDIASGLNINDSDETWEGSIGILIQLAEGFKGDATKSSLTLSQIEKKFTSDSSGIKTDLEKLHAALNGEHGILSNLKKELKSEDKAINDLIAAEVASSLGVLGGVAMVAVGGVADFVTAGTSTAVVLSGVALMAGSTAGIVESSIALNKELEAKTKTLTEQTECHDVVKALAGINSTLSDVSTKISDSVELLTDMADAWDMVLGSLTILGTIAKYGKNDKTDARKSFLLVAEQEAKDIVTQTGIIEKQMTGSVVAPTQPGSSLTAMITKTANNMNC